MSVAEHDHHAQNTAITVTVWALVLGLIEYGAERGVQSFPPNGDQLWHEWLYDVKRFLEPLFPEIRIGRFDWDRSYPTHPALETMYMATLGYHCQRSGGDYRIEFRNRRREANPLKANPVLGEYTFNLAGNRPGFFEF
ncbi:hypothetical protein C4552_01220 [Candidatus Parcubacteria bacterium]|nr:MAG: hypothetical protein C4552_01220 [Candidatus Parcubacteria bacterium]